MRSRTARTVVAVIAATGCLALPAAGVPPPFTKRGTVIQIVDAQTIAVRVSGGATANVHVLGIKGPDVDGCGYATATADITDLAFGQLAWLVGDRAQPVHDRAGRLIAYVVLPRGLDLGLELIKRGDAQLDPAAHGFKQLPAYRKAQTKAEATSLGLWACDPSTSPGNGNGGHGNPHPGGPAQGNGSKNR